MLRTVFAAAALVAAPACAMTFGPIDGIDAPVSPAGTIDPFDISPAVFSEGLLEGTGVSIGALPNPEKTYIVTLAGTPLLPYQGGATGKLAGLIGPALTRDQRYILSTTFSQIDDPIWHLRLNARGQAVDVSPVPEPGEWAMIAAGLGAVGWVARRRKARPAG